ncbi:fibrinogen like 1B [Lepisosteus oculatus]|uniref:fibrinogen like 1B n=1 Tax=Lepisosteus oculatus TaxID=7918 RepID=UPI0037166958
MSLVLILLFVSQTLAASRLSENELCLSELSQLNDTIKNLQNKLFIGEWQLLNLRQYKYFFVDNHWPRHNKSLQGPTLLPTTGGNLIVYDQDCSMLYDRQKVPSGFYRIKPKLVAEPFLVYCDMTDGAGWTVFQQRRSGRVDFNREWSDYKEGFGHFKRSNDEYWLGNEHIYSLLLGGDNLVKIELMDWKGEKKHAYYENFQIADEKNNYQLRFGLYSGSAGDALSGGGGVEQQWSASHNAMLFSTKDRDNDRFLQGSCAKENKGGWWYNRCHAANLNGKYYRGGEYRGKYDNGVVWMTWSGLWYSLRHTTMKVRPLVFMDSWGSGEGGLV